MRALGWLARLPLPAVLVAAGLLGLSVVFTVLDKGLGLDSAIYRAGALTLLQGDPLYDPLTTEPSWAQPLPFAYPPAAAALFVPLVLVPAQLGWGVIAALSTLALGGVLRVLGTRALPVVLLAMLALEPVWRTLALGQLNLLLMALVVLDVLALKGSRFSGGLIGLAAAVKLTPLIFVPYLLLTGRRADAARATGTFVALNGIGAALWPADTVRFWTVQLFDGNDVTTNAWIGNQSFNGAAQRLLGPGPATLVLVGAFSLLCLGMSALLVRRLHRGGNQVGALLVAAFCGLMVSPVSWSHHWVWVVPLAAFLLPKVSRWARVTLAGLAVICTGWEFFVVPGSAGAELRWSPLEAVPGNAYVLGALCLAGFVLVRMARMARPPKLVEVSGA